MRGVFESSKINSVCTRELGKGLLKGVQVSRDLFEEVQELCTSRKED